MQWDHPTRTMGLEGMEPILIMGSQMMDTGSISSYCSSGIGGGI
jgi:hypothetical protein